METTYLDLTSLYTKHRPKVRLLAKTQIVDRELLYDINHTSSPCYKAEPDRRHPPDGQSLVEFAGRACYQSFSNPSGRTNREYIKNIKAQKHFSVIEHTNVTFYIETVDRDFTHELIRHRHLSFSEISQRYVDMSSAPMVAPPLIREDPELYAEFTRSVEQSRSDYEKLINLTQKRHPGLKRKQIREAARRVLPGATETKIVVTGNLRTWRELLEKRFSIHADASICEVAEELVRILQEQYPAVFGDMEFQTD